jgi:hypothetical protein
MKKTGGRKSRETVSLNYTIRLATQYDAYFRVPSFLR